MTDLVPLEAPALLALDEVEVSSLSRLGMLDHRCLDWSRVRRSSFLLHQHLRYEYPAPIRDLRHRLVVLPPPVHGDQVRAHHRLEVSGAGAQVTRQVDRYGNTVVRVGAQTVRHAIEFEAWAIVERSAEAGPPRLPATSPAARSFLTPTALTRPDTALRQVAAEFRAHRGTALDLARRINAWVHATMTYEDGATDVRTTAGEALALGRGVCQDYAHVMLALCRLCRLPSRYVSGHLLGEGGSHAWVEVLVPESAAWARAGRAAAAGEDAAVVAVAFDPTHGRQADLAYLTVAVGRDYADVAPTSGTFRASLPGLLSSRKRLGVAAVELAAA